MTDTYGREAPDPFTSGSYQRGRSQHDGRARDSFLDSEGGTRDRLRGFANRQKDIGVDKMAGFAEAAHKAADALGEQNSGMADLIHEAADGLSRASEDLRGRDVSELYRSLNDFARRQPLTFFACSFAAGVLLSRFLKSSSDGDRRTSQHHHQGDEQQYHPSPSL
ncbi:MAG TPA: hypothetical protein VN004_12365 [Pseudorhodoplanes sp.]|jgi:hypothetical protein|nr:hypothetical protein [Pseudorhodoplanes sp.]